MRRVEKGSGLDEEEIEVILVPHVPNCLSSLVFLFSEDLRKRREQLTEDAATEGVCAPPPPHQTRSPLVFVLPSFF